MKRAGESPATPMRTIFYLRCGERISRAKVIASKNKYAETFLTGEGVAGRNSRTINPRIAERIYRMTAEEFCRETGAFTYTRK